ncbi:MAG: PD40 domain-containing protein [Bacteroidaceae bacterium]|nr:PD40 domain-containing protein [Bacteroidaceae bacterium]
MNFAHKAILAAIAMVSSSAMNAETPLWLRQSAISPDGKTIVFCYQGDLFTVSANGGEARQLTTNTSYDTAPVWSPDGKRIAFASDRDGHMDVFVIPAKGGNPVRVTASTSSEMPVAFTADNKILYSAYIMPSAQSMQFPSATFKQVYEVAIPTAPNTTPRPKMVSSLPMEHISISKDGNTWLYNDKKGYEDQWRKHHTSSITRDVWAWNKKDNKYTKLTSFKGEDREPVWGDGNTFYYLSEESGSFNLYKRAVEGTTSTPLTSFKNHPMRYLTRSNNGVFCFSYNGELYTLKEGEQPKKLNVEITKDCTTKDVIRQTLSSGVGDYSISPNGKELAIVLHGDVYVTSVDYNTTRQITDTPGQERNVFFAPDGKSVIYDSERNGLWQIYQTSIEDKDCTSFTRAKAIKEENITKTDKTSFQPQVSPDGKKVAYLENRTTLRVVDIKSGKIVTALDGKFNYSYSDGDVNFSWSPDSKWLLCDYIGIGGWNNKDIALVKADGSEVHDLTNSGYTDSNAKWVLDGKAMVWSSDRAGYRSHGSWGAEEDYYIMFFDVDAYDKFRMNKEDLEILEESKSKKEKKEEEKKEEKKEKAEKKAEEKGEVAKVEDLELDLNNLEDRIVRLTSASGYLGDCVLDAKGENFYYVISSVEGSNLWKKDLKEGNTTKLASNVSGGILVDKDVKTMYYRSNGVVCKMGIGSSDSKRINFTAQFNYRPAQEREYIFEHCWRQVNEKFYDPKIHGIDWKMYHDNYKKFLPYITNNYDFADLISEILGELNGSHTGGGYRASYRNNVGRLGLFYADNAEGNGMKIEEIVAKSPLALKKTDVKSGMTITHVDGVEITDSLTLDYLLTGKIGVNVTLTINKGGSKSFDVTVKPISQSAETALLYKRWVERNRKYVEEKTNGKIGYIHIEGMNSPSFRVLYSELLGRYRNTEGVIIDTRHNGGGWLHDDVVTLLSGKEYQKFMPRGQYVGSDPYNKYTKKSCMLVCEDNYSNAHGTPWLYKELGVGKLIGTPVAGTMTAVWWETQIDQSLYFGIPQVGCVDRQGDYLENKELQPDILIYNDPADVQAGKDAQLDAAIEEMMRK